MDLCYEYLEEYKRLDALCRDLLSSKEGVSEYIRQMELTPWQSRRYARFWEDDYAHLQRARRLRNQIAHAVDAQALDSCRQEDLAWVKHFYSRIINGDDPFSSIRKERTRREDLYIGEVPQESAREGSRRYIIERSRGEGARSKSKGTSGSFWARLVDSIKDIFS